MNGTAAAPADAGWRRTFALVALAALCLAPGTLGRELLPPDEPRFALVGREMYEDGDVVVLHRGGQLYTDKPPLLFWGQALVFAATGGPSETGARVPPLLATLLLVGALHRTARRWCGEPLATRATLVFTSFSLVLQRGAWVATDALLAATVFGAISATDLARGGKARWEIAAGALAGLAVLAKGPVALVFLAFAGLAGRWPGHGVFSIRPLLRPRAIAAFLAVALPWPVLLSLRLGATQLARIVWHQNVERYVDSWDNIEPWWYLGPTLLVGMLPWSLALAALFWPRVRRALFADPRPRWIAASALAALLFFSVPACKRGVYLLPLYPLLAVLVAGLAPEALRRAGARRTVAGLAGALGALVAIAGASVASTGWPLPPGILAIPGVQVASAVGLALVAGGLALLGLGAITGSARLFFFAPVSLAAALGLLFPPLLTPALDRIQGARAFARVIAPHVAPGVPVGLTKTRWEVVAWYAGLRGPVLMKPSEVRAFLSGPNDRVVVGALDEFGPPGSWPAGTRLVHRLRMGRDEMGVLHYRPVDTRAPGA
ncbi:MAG: glycosyltransferase family 39 protein [Acidobacteria bacterium]|nr:glycosyltransferase family 39 protein [Acidobacteriota bacterium]